MEQQSVLNIEDIVAVESSLVVTFAARPNAVHLRSTDRGNKICLAKKKNYNLLVW
jgi:hypothetical protein